MNRGQHIHMARLKAENDQFRATAPTPITAASGPSSDETAELKLKVQQLEAENKRLELLNQRLIKLANLHS